MSMIDVAATPECLIAVDAVHDGRWLSPLQHGDVPGAFLSDAGSWEERVGLLTYNNVTTANGRPCFFRIEKFS